MSLLVVIHRDFSYQTFFLTSMYHLNRIMRDAISGAIIIPSIAQKWAWLGKKNLRAGGATFYPIHLLSSTLLLSILPTPLALPPLPLSLPFSLLFPPSFPSPPTLFLASLPLSSFLYPSCSHSLRPSPFLPLSSFLFPSCSHSLRPSPFLSSLPLSSLLPFITPFPPLPSPLPYNPSLPPSTPSLPPLYPIAYKLQVVHFMSELSLSVSQMASLSLTLYSQSLSPALPPSLPP